MPCREDRFSGGGGSTGASQALRVPGAEAGAAGDEGIAPSSGAGPSSTPWWDDPAPSKGAAKAAAAAAVQAQTELHRRLSQGERWPCLTERQHACLCAPMGWCGGAASACIWGGSAADPSHEAQPCLLGGVLTCLINARFLFDPSKPHHVLQTARSASSASASRCWLPRRPRGRRLCNRARSHSPSARD